MINGIAIVMMSLTITGLLAAGSFLAAWILGITHTQAAISGIIVMFFVMGGVGLIASCAKPGPGKKSAGRK